MADGLLALLELAELVYHGVARRLRGSDGDEGDRDSDGSEPEPGRERDRP